MFCNECENVSGILERILDAYRIVQHWQLNVFAVTQSTTVPNTVEVVTKKCRIESTEIN